MSAMAKENRAHFIQMSVLQRVTHHKDARQEKNTYTHTHAEMVLWSQTHSLSHTHTKQQKWTVYIKYAIRMKWTNDLLRSVSIRFPSFFFCSIFITITLTTRIYFVWVSSYIYIQRVWHIWFTIKLCHALWLSSFVEYFYIVTQSIFLNILSNFS